MTVCGGRYQLYLEILASYPSYVEFKISEWRECDVYGGESRTTDTISRTRQLKVR